MNNKSGTANRLINEKSPYLLQHAYNPVDWHPWGDEAFEKAVNEDKPVLLSIGYSTCHWCHVMERESFEDSSVAGLMNNVFVNIKVDREERPDIDNIYMTVCQMMTGAGGWPLTIIMTPDKKPFFSGTYFPKENRYGRIGFVSLIEQISKAWKEKRNEINESADQITNYLNEDNSAQAESELNTDILDKAYKSFEERFDNECGGFGASPKFPSPHNLMFLLRYWKRTGSLHALTMVEKTLTGMRKGGIFDHIGLGFHRYSTDKEWLLPHFEKMLYDQAMISSAIVETYQATQNEEYKIIAEETFEYVLRDMTSPEGGFYSAEDADSEGEEGKFYVWTEKEIDALLENDSTIFKKVFNILPHGNYSEESSRKPNGSNIPHLNKSLHDYSIELNKPKDELNKFISKCRSKLFKKRIQRIPPLKDDKILTDWNALMITSLAKGGKVFGEKKYLTAAEKCAEFILNKLMMPDGRLIHRYREGESSLQAHADDYAFLIQALLELYEATYKVDYLKKAVSLNEVFINDFYDKEKGGFFFTSDKGERLIARRKEIYDGAIPSGNSVGLLNLLKLGRITADSKYEDTASAVINAFSEEISKHPSAYTQFLIALDFAFGPSIEAVIVEGNINSQHEEIISSLNEIFMPNKIILYINEINRKEIAGIAGYTASHTAVDNQTAVYICRNYQCSLPVTEKKELLDVLYE